MDLKPDSSSKVKKSISVENQTNSLTINFTHFTYQKHRGVICGTQMTFWDIWKLKGIDLSGFFVTCKYFAKIGVNHLI